MQVKDLVKTDLSSLSDDELEGLLSQLSRPIKTKKSASGATIGGVKSNKEKQLSDLLSKMSPEQLKKFKAILGALE